MANDNANASTVSVVDLFEVDGSDNSVFLDFRAGAEGQASLTTVKINRTVVEEDVEGSFEQPLSIGANADLDGKTLRIKTTITDLSDLTNDTFIDITITGGAQDYHHRFEKTVTNERDSVFYSANIIFFKR